MLTTTYGGFTVKQTNYFKMVIAMQGSKTEVVININKKRTIREGGIFD